ncbi:MAG: hypothetical protein ACRBBR_16465 [Cellvibrionaceae bacterium]
MFIEDDYDNDRQDAIQSILTSAMGRAAKSLEKIIDSNVVASVPSVNWINKNNLKDSLSKINLPDKSIVMRQSFRGHLRGEMLILLEQGAKHYQLGGVMGYEEKMSPLNIQELTLEFANILSGACISGLSDQLNIKLTFGSPTLLSSKASVHDVLNGKNLQWIDALFMDVAYTVSSIEMKAHLMLCMIEEDSHELYRIIDLQLGQL